MNSQEIIDTLNGNEIAIIGMSGRFPGAPDIQTFWQNLVDGVCSISTFTDEELREAGVAPETLHDPSYVKAGGIIEGAELFDANFFGYSPREAEIIDPQQRLFLETAWTALEDAGYATDEFPGSIGVYAGVTRNTYLLNHLYSNPEVLETVDGFQLLIASDKDHLATRTAYKLNLRGPSFTVQTACSTSLVAIHLAAQSLLNGECDLALAGGVSVKAPQKRGYFYQEGGIFSSDGFCRTFDAAAEGTIDTNGLGVVVLKRLGDALEQQDHIYAVIKGSAINNDGALKVGYTAPSVQGQAAVIGEALALASLEPEDISYVEAHGTATPLGDPIELAALQQVFGAATDNTHFCAIGSVKSNIGHVDVAAGVAGVIKTTLALQHGYLPASLHFTQPNPAINLIDSPFYVNATPQPWQKKEAPRRAGVSSFGIGGTNAHVILEEAPVLAPPEKHQQDQHLLVLSAKTPTALARASQNLADYLESHADSELADVTYTLQVGRNAFNYRQILVCQDGLQAVAELRTEASTRIFRSQGEPGKHPIIFLFPGQGSQYVGMAQELYEQEAVFRAEVDRCCIFLQPLLGVDLRAILYPTHASEEASQQINQTQFAQPALFVIEYALATLWMHWGVQPTAFVGHSIGEYVAACLSGVFSLEDALTIVATRGRLMQQQALGSMLAVSLDAARLSLPEDLSLAAINSPGHCVVSGPTESIRALEHTLQTQGVECRHLHTSHAFHSAMLDAALPEFTEAMRTMRLSPPQIPYLSNVSGTWITDEEALDPQYWVQHLRQTVLFGPSLQELKAKAEWILLEVGPGQTLGTLARQSLPEYLILASLPAAQHRSSALAALLTTLGRLWLTGSSVNWPHLYTQPRPRLSLPTYPFERERFWIELPTQTAATVSSHTQTARQALADWFYVPGWIQSIVPRSRTVADERPGNWLVFIDTLDFTARIARSLQEQGAHVVSVRAGEGFAHIDENDYTINPRRAEDYQVLISALLARHLTPDHVIHGWQVTPLEPAGGTTQFVNQVHQRLASSLERGYYSLVYLAQAIDRQNILTPVSLHVLSNAMQSIPGAAALAPEKSTMLGPCKTIPQEYSYMRCQSIDFLLPEGEGWQRSKLAEQLLNEIQAEQPEPMVAYRQQQRWLPTFEPVRMPDQTASSAMLRPRGVYLLVGGMGDIGLLFAEYLSKTVQADLALLGRSDFPDRDSWDAWLTRHDEQDPISRKIRRLQAMEQSGSRILLLQADVCDQDQMSRALTAVEAHLGQLHGVVYAAGSPSSTLATPLNMLDLTHSEQQFQTKIYGLLTLEKVLEGKSLDFCLFQSSLASILGGLGFTAYAASNLFCDAYIQAHNQLSPVPWLAINWDSWQFKQEAVDHPFQPNTSITAQEGLQAFSYLFQGTTSQLVVSTRALKTRLAQWINPGTQNTAASTNEESGRTAHSRPQLQNAYLAPRNDVERQVAAIWESCLGIEQIGVHDSFFELGGHSLLATQLISHLRTAFPVSIHLQEIFETPTVAGVAEIIQQKTTTVPKPAIKPVRRQRTQVTIDSATGRVTTNQK